MGRGGLATHILAAISGTARNPGRGARMRTMHMPVAVLPLLAVLSACQVGPDYMRPAAPVRAMFKENAGWMPASPQQAAGWETWWAIYDDPVLDALEKEVDISNQNLKVAEASFR